MFLTLISCFIEIVLTLTRLSFSYSSAVLLRLYLPLLRYVSYTHQLFYWDCTYPYSAMFLTLVSCFIEIVLTLTPLCFSHSSAVLLRLYLPLLRYVSHTHQLFYWDCTYPYSAMFLTLVSCFIEIVLTFTPLCFSHSSAVLLRLYLPLLRYVSHTHQLFYWDLHHFVQ
jgi:hypothetical protein